MVQAIFPDLGPEGVARYPEKPHRCLQLAVRLNEGRRDQLLIVLFRGIAVCLGGKRGRYGRLHDGIQFQMLLWRWREDCRSWLCGSDRLGERSGEWLLGMISSHQQSARMASVSDCCSCSIKPP